MFTVPPTFPSPFAQTELDGHPTVSGHKYIADKIVKAIEAQQ